jgi:transglutaminase-like putative cysteine protease
MEYQVTHTTEYTYFRPVKLGHNLARLLLRHTGIQHCKNFSVAIYPVPDVTKEFEDFFGNKTLYFAIQQEHKKLRVSVKSFLEKKEAGDNAFLLNNDVAWEHIPAKLVGSGDENLLARQFIFPSYYTPINDDIIQYAKRSFVANVTLFSAAKDLTKRIFTDFAFTQGFTNVATPLSEVMKSRKGVCQDFAHLAIACVRSMGLPARYVSGYIETLPPPGKVKLFGADASHAWFSVYLPGAGWVDFDPTNNCMPGNQHITIGWGRDYADIAPLKGVVLSSGSHQLSVSVDVRRIF